jgi:CBS domain-containing protein
MKLADLLVDAWVAVPLDAATLEEALRGILQRVYRHGAVSEDQAERLAARLATGEAGEIAPVNDDVVAILGTVEGLEGPSVAVGVVREPFRISHPAAGVPDEARAVLLILAPGSVTKLRKELLPELVRVLRDPGRTERLVSAVSVAEIRGIRELMETEFRTPTLVEDALLPVGYRVYPDTPLAEVLDLIVRRGIRAVPVVGEQYEVLGIITSGDALGYLLHKGHPGEEVSRAQDVEDDSIPRARDVMTRTVLCVSEDQGLADAANMMVNRDVEQLPVVREGELVGFVTRDSILGALFGAPSENEDEQQEDDREP